MPESISIFTAVVTAIFLEALPFLALGALLSATIEVLVPSDRLARLVPKGRLRGIALGIAAGVVLPTCECGVVPVIRRLIRKGVPPHVAVAYMIAAPILNPVVIASTWFAFSGRMEMVLGRVAVAVVVAGVTGLVAARMGRVLANGTSGEDHDHDHGPTGPLGKLVEILRHGAHDLLDMGKFLIIGSVAAGLFKTYLPQEAIAFFMGNAALEIAGMMALAVLLSVCSEADAFVAVSFQVFSSAAHLAFVTLGPMLDLKLVGMYAITFRRSFFWFLIFGPAAMVFALSLFFQVIS